MADISEEGRRILRAAAVANGQSPDLGNHIADFLNRNKDVVVTITGRIEEPPLRVFGTNPGSPGVNIEPLEEEDMGDAPRGSGPIADSGQIGEQPPDPERASGPHVEQAEVKSAEISEEEAAAVEEAEAEEDTRTVSDLKAELEERGLPTSGTKPELLARLEADDDDEAKSK